MKKVVLGALAVAAGLATAVSAYAADAVTLQLKWVTQAQFAGYFVAKDKGFYKDENLDVTIKPGGPDIAPEQVIAAVERVLLPRVLRYTHGHQAQASELLGLNRSTLRHRLRALGLAVDKTLTDASRQERKETT